MKRIYERAYWLAHQKWDANYYQNKKETARYARVKHWIVERSRKAGTLSDLMETTRSLD